MKETIAEYARIIIVLIAFAVVGVFILGGTWFSRIGASLDGVDNAIKTEHQQDIWDKLDERELPVLTVQGKTFTTGTAVNLKSLIKEAKVYNDDCTETIDVKDEVVITCDNPDFDAPSNTLILQTAGVYTVKYSIKDDFGLSVSKIIKIVAVDKIID